MPNIPALDRLKAQLLASGIQERNQALYQVVNQLIDSLRQSNDGLQESIDSVTSSVTTLSTTVSTATGLSNAKMYTYLVLGI